MKIIEECIVDLVRLVLGEVGQRFSPKLCLLFSAAFVCQTAAAGISPFVVEGKKAVVQTQPSPAQADGASIAKVFVQLGHSGIVRSVAFSPDGRSLASGGDDATIKLWDVENGRERRSLLGHSRAVKVVAFSPDRRTLASGSGDNTIKLWDVESGRELHSLVSHTDEVTTVVFSPDGRTLASGSGDKTVKIWNVESGRELRSMNGHFSSVYSVAFSPDGLVLASGSADASISLWEVQSGRQLRTFAEHESGVNTVAFSPDGRTLASGSTDDSIKLWDMENAVLRLSLRGHSNGGVFSVAFARDGRTLASGGDDGTIKHWDVETGLEQRSWNVRFRFVYSVAFSPDGGMLASNGPNNTITLWDIKTGRDRSLSGHSWPVDYTAFSPDGRTLALAFIGMGGTVKYWSVETGRELRRLSLPTAWASAVAFSPDGRMLASAGSDHTIRLSDVETGREWLRPISGHSSWVQSIAFSPNGLTLASGSADGTIKLWDVESGRELRSLSGHSHIVYSVAFSPDGRRLASGGSSGDIKLWNVETGSELHSLTRQRYAVNSVAFSPDGRSLASGGEDNNIKLWDVETGIEQRSLVGHSSRVMSVVFSPDSSMLASGSWDNTVKLWDVKTGIERRSLNGHSDQVTTVAFSPDGRTIASGSTDTTTRLWNSETGQQLAQLISFNDSSSLTITADGYYDYQGETAEDSLSVYVGNQIFGIGQYREKFYRPDLVKLSLAGVSLATLRSLSDTGIAPQVSLANAPAETVITDEIELKLRITDQGGGIGEVRLFVGGSSQSTSTVQAQSRGGQRTMDPDVHSFKVGLVSGENKIRAVVFNAENSMESAPVELTVTAAIKDVEPSLHAVIVGVQQFANPRLQLRYSAADAELVAARLREQAAPLFKSVNIQLLTTPAQTTVASIVAALETAKAQAKAEDLFVFYVASHGTMGQDEYLLLTSDSAALEGSAVANGALGSSRLKRLLANVGTTKKLVVIDTCLAGELGKKVDVELSGQAPSAENLLSRSLSRDPAIRLLATAVGSAVLSATNSLEQASEGYEGHGVYTWALGEALGGKADNSGDGLVDTDEISGYLSRRVPDLAKLVFKRTQTPNRYLDGEPFPVARVSTP